MSVCACVCVSVCVRVCVVFVCVCVCVCCVCVLCVCVLCVSVCVCHKGGTLCVVMAMRSYRGNRLQCALVGRPSCACWGGLSL